MPDISPVTLDKVRIQDSFWFPRTAANRERTIPAVYRKLQETGRLDAFRLGWKPGMEPKPHCFWDSDVAKWTEAACYTLMTHPDSEMRVLVDSVVDLILSAQQPDGYLNTYITAVAPEQRWKNLQLNHELYCAGTLIEASVAHFQSTGERKFLNAMCRYADYIDSVFGRGQGKIPGYCGHEEIELALVRLYRTTGEQRYLRLSKYFLDERGQPPLYFHREAVPPRFADEYFQAHIPIREQTDTVGHAVRAMFLYSAMADVAAIEGDAGLRKACERLWESATTRRMYLTGGIGSARDGERFTEDYDLPNRTAYCETCAAFGLILWSHRMLHWTRDSRYADVMERTLYNGFLSGVSLDGEKFLYENPLESSGHHHRQSWFDCACCPPNIARLLASLGGYIYSTGNDDVMVHLYVQSAAQLKVGRTAVQLAQKSDYPWNEETVITVDPESPAKFGMNLRLPDWCMNPSVQVNGEPFDLAGHTDKGYVRIYCEWRPGDKVRIALPMAIRRIHAHPSVRDASGSVALQRGPLVYCLEGVDNPVPLHRVVLPDNARLRAETAPGLLGGVVTIVGDALAESDADWEGRLYRDAPSHLEPIRIRAVPYYAWDNRAPGEMRVWVRRK